MLKLLALGTTLTQISKFMLIGVDRIVEGGHIAQLADAFKPQVEMNIHTLFAAYILLKVFYKICKQAQQLLKAGSERKPPPDQK